LAIWSFVFGVNSSLFLLVGIGVGCSKMPPFGAAVRDYSTSPHHAEQPLGFAAFHDRYVKNSIAALS
jgi:hypothetical protein